MCACGITGLFDVPHFPKLPVQTDSVSQLPVKCAAQSHHTYCYSMTMNKRGDWRCDKCALSSFPIPPLSPKAQSSALPVHIYTSVTQTHVTTSCEVCPLQHAIQQEGDLQPASWIKHQHTSKKEIHGCVLKWTDRNRHVGWALFIADVNIPFEPE